MLIFGDFHGKFPAKFEKLFRKGEIDVVISLGDYLPFYHRKLWFKHCYGKETDLWEIIGKKRVKEGIRKDWVAGKRIFRKLNNLSVPVFTVVGNVDGAKINDSLDYKKSKGKKLWKWYEKDHFSPIIKNYKNIKRIDYSYAKFGDFVFIGAYGHTFPGKVMSENYKKYKKKIESLFRKFKKENKDKNVILVSHNVPYNTKLDKVSKNAHEKARGKHYGSKLIKRIIDKYQPVLAIGGHIHESWGKDKVKKTLVVNPGAVVEGRGAVVDIPERKGKIKVKFIK